MARSGRTKANRKRSKRARSPWRGVGRLAALLGFSLAALGLVALVFRVDAEPSVWDTLFVDSPTGQHVFAGGIFLGMNADALSRYHPDVEFAANGAGGHRGIVRDGDGVHTVWFANGRDDAPAFRLTSELTLAGARMDGVLELFAAHHPRSLRQRRPSRPALATSLAAELEPLQPIHLSPARIGDNSTDRAYDSRIEPGPWPRGAKCHYRWLTKGSVSIDLYVTGDRAGGGGTSTKIRVVAVDINLEAARPHARGTGSAAKTRAAI